LWVDLTRWPDGNPMSGFGATPSLRVPAPKVSFTHPFVTFGDGSLSRLSRYSWHAASSIGASILQNGAYQISCSMVERAAWF
jgi:hypothetical protein